MNESAKMIWAAAFAKIYLEKRDYELACVKAQDAVMAFHIAANNTQELRDGNVKDMLCVMSRS